MLFGCDHQGLLQRILALTDQSFANPSTTMAPDWDIVQATVQTLRLLPVMPAITHVKGHQDDNTAIENLSILARSNCAADVLATTHNRLQGKKCSSVPRIEGNPIQLHINGKTINSKYEQAIRFAALAPAIINQIKRRNDWNDETFHSVDWEAQRIASNRQTIRRESPHCQAVPRHAPCGKVGEPMRQANTPRVHPLSVAARRQGPCSKV